MAEPSIEEIKQWKSELTDVQFRKRLDKFQLIVFDVCEEHRRNIGMRYIRAVLPRQEIKSFESVARKITDKRDDSPQYSFKDIEDLIGVKIFCPYPSSAISICKWLIGQNSAFQVFPKQLREAKRRRKMGYKGYHFTAYPNLQKDTDLLCVFRSN